MPAEFRAGPHQIIAGNGAAERFTAQFLDVLWDRYRTRVSYAADYQRIVGRAGGTFVNDHIAFRTFAANQPTAGIISVSRIFEALGFRAAGCYQFPDKHLGAIHFAHPNIWFPKIFISELRVWELDGQTRSTIRRVLASHRSALSDDTLERLASLDDSNQPQNGQLLETLVDWFVRLPWDIPRKDDVLAVNQQSQYAAWVLVHGYRVNHFTSLVNAHGVEALDDIEKTIAAMQAAGVPMKAEIEGVPGSKLRQTATEAVHLDVDVIDQGRPTTMPWTYAYFEIAQRGLVADPETGQMALFQGFLGPQATQLFEMTRLAKG